LRQIKRSVALAGLKAGEARAKHLFGVLPSEVEEPANEVVVVHDPHLQAEIRRIALIVRLKEAMLGDVDALPG